MTGSNRSFRKTEDVNVVGNCHFTPINRFMTISKQNARKQSVDKDCTPANTAKSRNPLIASYLGLDNEVQESAPPVEFILSRVSPLSSGATKEGPKGRTKPVQISKPSLKRQRNSREEKPSTPAFNNELFQSNGNHLRGDTQTEHSTSVELVKQIATNYTINKVALSSVRLTPRLHLDTNESPCNPEPLTVKREEQCRDSPVNLLGGITDDELLDVVPSSSDPLPCIDYPRLPITRPPFPRSVRDRSPIIGLSTEPVLRTCFRIGDAVNAGRRAVRLNQSVVLEIYARVQRSWREVDGVRQYFNFHDIYHSHGPFLEGSYEIWKGVPQWDEDCKPFLGSSGQGKMARVVGKMKRVEGHWKLTILNIWEATWDDLDFVQGIICA